MDLAADVSPEDLEVFLQEADEQLRLLDEDVVKLERENSAEVMQEIFRAAHTLKGSSGMLGYRPMTDLAHAMETVLDRLRKDELALSTPVVDALLHSLDTMRELRDELADPSGQDINIASVVAELEAVGGSDAPSGDEQAAPAAAVSTELVLDPTASERLAALVTEGQVALRVAITLESGTDWASIRLFQVLTELSELGEVVASSPSAEQVEGGEVGDAMTLIVATRLGEEAVRERAAAVADVASVTIDRYQQEAAASQSQSGGGERKGVAQAQTVRIDVERLDELMNTISELVIDRTRIGQIGKALEARYKGDDMVDALSQTSAHIVRVVDELQENTRRVRMQPIGTVFGGLPRLVRDIAQKMDKQVEFDVSGHETEIDRTVIERIRDPLVHLLRNSVDHGLESPEVRRAAGKTETGRINLDAYHEQGFIVIEVRDDGGGINLDAVKAAAVRKGLLPMEAASRLTDSEAMNLIFLAGASTAKQTTEISGRGVGMDIVKANIEAINGIVSVESKFGEWTKFTLKLPLTLATLQALLLVVEETVYAIPLVYVTETVAVPRQEISTVAGHEVIQLRESVIPLIRLQELLGLRRGQEDSDGPVPVVVVQFRQRLIGLAVDSLMESQEIVVKPLGTFVGEVRGIAGASILGDGQIVLIVDVPTAVGDLVLKAAQETGGAVHSEVASAA